MDSMAEIKGLIQTMLQQVAIMSHHVDMLKIHNSIALVRLSLLKVSSKTAPLNINTSPINPLSLAPPTHFSAAATSTIPPPTSPFAAGCGKTTATTGSCTPIQNPSINTQPLLYTTPKRQLSSQENLISNLPIHPLLGPDITHIKSAIRSEPDTDRLTSLSVDLVSCNTIMFGWAKAGFVDETRYTLDEMLRRNGVTWSTFVVYIFDPGGMFYTANTSNLEDKVAFRAGGNDTDISMSAQGPTARPHKPARYLD